MAMQNEHWITPAEYHEIEQSSNIKYEYVDGRIYAMSGGTQKHATIAGNIFAVLKAHLRGKPCKVFNSDMKVQLFERDDPSYFPDVTVTCNESDISDDLNVIRSPRFLVEVLSPSTASRDRGRKLSDYLLCNSVEEYVIISTRYQKVEIYQRQSDIWTYRQFTAGQEITLMSMKLTFPISALYEDTTVSEERFSAVAFSEPDEE
jgi:Uma2 family endonuclease